MRLALASVADAVSTPIRERTTRRRRTAFVGRFRLAAERLDALAGTLPPRLLYGTAIAALVAAIPLLARYSPACAGKYAAAAAFLAVPLSLLVAPPRGGAVPARRLAGRRSLAEDGFTILEALVCAALIASLVIGGTAVFSQQKQSIAQVTTPDVLRDDVAALDVDANALQAYDAGVRSKIQSGGTQLWTAPMPGTQQLATIQAQPASSGVSVVAKVGTQAASIVAPLPQPKPTPQ